MKSKHVMQKEDKIYVAGHRGLVGSALVRRLRKEGFNNIVMRTHSELDLTNQQAVENFFAQEQPDYVFMCAAKVGGIQANKEARDAFLYLNVMMEFNSMMSSFRHGVKKYCLVGSGTIYPKEAAQPFREKSMLSGVLEPINEGLALAKIAGIKLSEYLNETHPDTADFITAVPCNLYGPGDSYHPQYSHVIPALTRRFHEAKERGDSQLTMWGTGAARREFLHADDMADACLFVMQNFSGDSGSDGARINLGTGQEYSMQELGHKVAEAVGYKGTIVFDHVHPDGAPRMALDSSRLFALGWRPSISFEEGLRQTYEDYKVNKDNYRNAMS